jgi:hypothetical protein
MGESVFGGVNGAMALSFLACSSIFVGTLGLVWMLKVENA